MFFFIGVIIYVGLFIWAIFLLFKGHDDISRELERLKSPTILAGAIAEEAQRSLELSRAEVARLKAKLEQQNLMLAAQDNDIKQFDARFERVVVELKEYEERMTNLKSELAKKESELQVLAAVKDEDNRKINDELEKIKKSLQARIFDLTAKNREIDGLKESLEKAQILPKNAD